jgi:glycine/D-amino acid oxidase-like deaminating enzyme
MVVKNSQNIVVIGAGVIGLSLAWQLTALGAKVTVVEADRPGAGTSSTSFAWVNASSKVAYSTSYFALNSLALQEHHALAKQAGAESWLHPTGDIELAGDAAEAASLERKVRRLRRLGYRAELLTPGALQDLEPGAAFPNGGAAAFYADEGWVEVQKLVTYLLRVGGEAGAKFITSDPVREVLRRAAVATGVKLASGTVIAADIVVTAMGRWTSAFAAALQIDVPLTQTDQPGSKAVGLLARIAPTANGPNRVLHSRDVNWSPLPAGRALIASDTGDETVSQDRSPEVAAAAAQALLDRAAALNPIFTAARLEHHQIGLRALPIDGEAICGWAGGIESLYVLVTHSGVTLAPLLGKLAAREIVTGNAEPLLSAFRLERFSGQEHDGTKTA